MYRVHQRQTLLLMFLACLAGCGEDKPASRGGVEQVPTPPISTPSSPPAPHSVDAVVAAESPALEGAPTTTLRAPVPVVPEARTSRETSLRRLPDPASPLVRMLPEASAVLVTERRGGWYLVRAGTDEGWVQLMHLTRTGASASSATGVVDEISAIATGRAGAGNIASTTGIRGLKAEDLQLASPNMAALTELDQHAVSSAKAAEAAAAWGLTARKIAYLPEPSK